MMEFRGKGRRASRLAGKPARARTGMTILEVIVATAIFVGGMAILGQLSRLGLAAAEANQRKTDGLLRAESKMAQISMGLEPLDLGAEALPFDDNPHWTWSVASEPTEVTGLLRVSLIVEHRDREDDETPDYDFRLTRLLVDPGWGRPPASTPVAMAASPITIPRMLGLPPKAAPTARGGSVPPGPPSPGAPKR